MDLGIWTILETTPVNLYVRRFCYIQLNDVKEVSIVVQLVYSSWQRGLLPPCSTSTARTTAASATASSTSIPRNNAPASPNPSTTTASNRNIFQTIIRLTITSLSLLLSLPPN